MQHSRLWIPLTLVVGLLLATAHAAPTRGDGAPTDRSAEKSFRTLEDLYGPTGETFQAAIGILNTEADSGASAPSTSYGIGVDDVVVQWREVSLSEDQTDCAGGSCAVIELQTANFFSGDAILEVSLVDSTPYGSRCSSAGICEVTGEPCSSVDGCGSRCTVSGVVTNAGVLCNADSDCPVSELCRPTGGCLNDICFIDGDCAQGSCDAVTNDCNGNAWHFDALDDTDCDGNGVDDVLVTLTSESEANPAERLVCNRVSGDLFAGEIPLSATYNMPGVLFVQTQGTDVPSVTASYEDIDDGNGDVCLNSINPKLRGSSSRSSAFRWFREPSS